MRAAKRLQPGQKHYRYGKGETKPAPIIEKPILMSAPMVLSTLAGTKTNTRRILQIKGHKSFTEFGRSDTKGYDWHFRDEAMRWHDLRHDELLKRLRIQKNDRLWVKETWRPKQGYGAWDLLVDYRADGTSIRFEEDDINPDWNWPKAADTGNVSPLFMPRWASRIDLTVTDVRIQRLQDISEQDAIAEGINKMGPRAFNGEYFESWRDYSRDSFSTFFHPKSSFRSLWESINGKDSWNDNPWVVAYTFERLKPAK